MVVAGDRPLLARTLVVAAARDQHHGHGDSGREGKARGDQPRRAHRAAAGGLTGRGRLAGGNRGLARRRGRLARRRGPGGLGRRGRLGHPGDRDGLPGPGGAQRVDQLVPALEAIVGRLGQRLRDDLGELRGAVGAELGHGRRRLVDVGHDHRHVLVLAERRPAGEALEQDAAERVDVGASVDLPALGLLRRRVADRADELAGGRQPADRAGVLGEPEVGEVDVIERLRRSPVDEQDVGRLDVAVDEPEPVRRVERARDLAADRDRALDLQRPGRAQQPSRSESSTWRMAM